MLYMFIHQALWNFTLIRCMKLGVLDKQEAVIILRFVTESEKGY